MHKLQSIEYSDRTKVAISDGNSGKGTFVGRDVAIINKSYFTSTTSKLILLAGAASILSAGIWHMSSQNPKIIDPPEVLKNISKLEIALKNNTALNNHTLTHKDLIYLLSFDGMFTFLLRSLVDILPIKSQEFKETVRGALPLRFAYNWGFIALNAFPKSVLILTMAGLMVYGRNEYINSGAASFEEVF